MSEEVRLAVDLLLVFLTGFLVFLITDWRLRQQLRAAFDENTSIELPDGKFYYLISSFERLEIEGKELRLQEMEARLDRVNQHHAKRIAEIDEELGRVLTDNAYLLALSVALACRCRYRAGRNSSFVFMYLPTGLVQLGFRSVEVATNKLFELLPEDTSVGRVTWPDRHEIHRIITSLVSRTHPPKPRRRKAQT